MRHLIIFLLLIYGCFTLQAQQITVTTVPSGATIVVVDTLTHEAITEKTPFEISVLPNHVYRYQVRHPFCHPDSGFLSFDAQQTEAEINLRPYEVNVSWEIDPQQAQYILSNLSTKSLKRIGETIHDLTLDGGKYELTLKKKNYRTYNTKFRFNKDTLVTVSHKMEYCPPRFTAALSCGMAAGHTPCLGVTLAYGGVNGVYSRFLTTLSPTPDGDEVDLSQLHSLLYCPYSDVKVSYLSAVLGYQYYTPWHLYLQLGVGYGKEQFSWLSEEDNKRHPYSPDTREGAVFDLGIGYPFGRFYVGAAVQSLTFTGESMAPFSNITASMFNICIIL